jgi:hypothetical protein
MASKTAKHSKKKSRRLKWHENAGKLRHEIRRKQPDPVIQQCGGVSFISPELLTSDRALQLQHLVGNRVAQLIVRSSQVQERTRGGHVDQSTPWSNSRKAAHIQLQSRKKPSRKTQMLINAVKQFRKGIQQQHSTASLEGLIVAVLKDKKGTKLENFDWLYRREHGIGLRDEIENLIKGGKLNETIKKRLPFIFPDKPGGLNEAMRRQAITIALGLKGKWPKQWVPSDVLAQWMFKEQVWTKLCSKFGGGVGYTKHYVGGGSTEWLFSPPTPTEIKKWQAGGVESFLRRIAKKIDKQLYQFSHDIGWFLTPKGTLMAGAEVLIGLRKTIREYQKSWEELGKDTGTLSDIKSMLPGKFMIYLWSEAERKKLRLWGKHYGKAPK